MASPSSTFVVTNRAALDQAVDPITNRVASTVANDTIARTPRATGRLAAGWKVVRTGRGGYAVTNDVSYARFVEYGTRRTPARAMLGQAAASARASYGR